MNGVWRCEGRNRPENSGGIEEAFLNHEFLSTRDILAGLRLLSQNIADEKSD
jgi:hypothetical protein